MKTAAILLSLIGTLLFGFSFVGRKKKEYPPAPPDDPAATPVMTTISLWRNLRVGVGLFANVFSIEVPSYSTFYPLALKSVTVGVLSLGVAGGWYVLVTLFKGQLGVSLPQLFGALFLVGAAIRQIIDVNSGEAAQ